MLYIWDSKLWRQDHLQLHDLLAEFYEKLPTGSRVIGWEHAEERTEGLVIS
jgi:hypothetical protein